MRARVSVVLYLRRMNTQFSLALARLDAEIAETEARLQDLRLRRKGAQAFLEYMEGPDLTSDAEPSASALPSTSAPRASGSPVEAVMAVFNRTPDVVLVIDVVHREVTKDGHTFDRQQVRNALHYATRRGWISKAGRRGAWVLRNASAPVAPGAEESEESASDSSIREGGPDHGSEPLRGRVESAGRPQALHDHAGF